ncbi:hypothetical protein [Microcoleus sp. Pol10D4]|uniref:hypothetical protein n=1 Tax=Microcoleus sp. Pol10D4 TaxID=3055387 RepID=UPI002FD136AB
MSFFAHLALTSAVKCCSGSMRRGVCVVGFLMPIDRSAHPIDKSAIAQAIFKLNNNRKW